ncbi:uncharacterized protein LOC111012916 [Momordica charantia]|uniref:Uncharacterized protein LOC111012916 n=1 Tax=Momordica charantia TaxID=3673 RepID=A0A6J1CMU3_MOMCH|nr:uncharacterized protein LOC111012916 [Momordica charantia]
MVCFCFLVDQKRKVRRTRPVAGTCSRCGRGAKVADMETSTRFCRIPMYSTFWKAIICSTCGALLKSYR